MAYVLSIGRPRITSHPFELADNLQRLIHQGESHRIGQKEREFTHEFLMSGWMCFQLSLNLTFLLKKPQNPSETPLFLSRFYNRLSFSHDPDIDFLYSHLKSSILLFKIFKVKSMEIDEKTPKKLPKSTKNRENPRNRKNLTKSVISEGGKIILGVILVLQKINENHPEIGKLLKKVFLRWAGEAENGVFVRLK